MTEGCIIDHLLQAVLLPVMRSLLFLPVQTTMTARCDAALRRYWPAGGSHLTTRLPISFSSVTFQSFPCLIGRPDAHAVLLSFTPT
jgi:hypothetical protein